METQETLKARIQALEEAQGRTTDILIEVLDANIEMATAMRNSRDQDIAMAGMRAFSSIESAVELLRQQEEKEPRDE